MHLNYLDRDFLPGDRPNWKPLCMTIKQVVQWTGLHVSLDSHSGAGGPSYGAGAGNAAGAGYGGAGAGRGGYGSGMGQGPGPGYGGGQGRGAYGGSGPGGTYGQPAPMYRCVLARPVRLLSQPHLSHQVVYKVSFVRSAWCTTKLGVFNANVHRSQPTFWQEQWPQS